MLLSLVFLFISYKAILAEASFNFISKTRLANFALQELYNVSSGLWDTTGWWNSANCLTTLGDLAAQDRIIRPQALSIFENTIIQAPRFNSGCQKVVTLNYMIHSLSLGVSKWPRPDPSGFINEFYDDEGWWALGWIQAYDVTANKIYLKSAIDIFNDMKKGATTNCSGGIWWDKNQTYVNAIANELYMSVASHLANRVQKRDRDSYRQIAEDQWRWFSKSGMINSDSLVNDGLTKECVNNNGTVWSYNQGVILGGLTELSRATSDPAYIDRAKQIANAAIDRLSDSNGVLHDPCEPNCGNDGTQFKGIFMRNLRALQDIAPEKKFSSFIKTNAVSVWNKNRNEDNQFGVTWSGPFLGPANASTQSSGMDALVAASLFQNYYS